MLELGGPAPARPLGATVGDGAPGQQFDLVVLDVADDGAYENACSDSYEGGAHRSGTPTPHEILESEHLAQGANRGVLSEAIHGIRYRRVSEGTTL